MSQEKTTNEKLIPPIHLPFDEVIGDVLKVKPEAIKPQSQAKSKDHKTARKK